MGSTMGTDNFETIEEFIDYLKINYGSYESVQHLVSWVTDLGHNLTSDILLLLKNLMLGLEIHDFYLDEIIGLFVYPPYPDVNQLLKALNSNANELKGFIDSFDRDPKAGRVAHYNSCGHIRNTSEQIIKEQFTYLQINPVVKQIKNLVQKTYLSSQELYDIAQQVTYINALGTEYPLVINHQNLVLSEVSRKKLREISDHLITTLRRPDISAEDKLKSQLNLIAVLREQFFRVTGLVADTTQLIAVLMSLGNERHNMLLQLDDFKRNSFTMAFIAVMQWINADGGTVDVCIADKEVGEHDLFNQSIKEFFIFLGIQSSQIPTSLTNDIYKPGGINYSTEVNLALYRARAQLEKEQLTAEKNGQALSSTLILVKSRFAIFDETAINDLKKPFIEFEFTKNFIDDYKAQGRIITLCETSVSDNELRDYSDKYDTKIAYKIPAHLETKHKKSAIAEQQKVSKENTLEQCYLRRVSRMQQVVMNQFEEWQAFLLLICSKNELKKLTNELLEQRDELIRTLDLSKQHCLEPLFKPSEYESSQPTVHSEQLENSLNLFKEKAVGEIWVKLYFALKEKAVVYIKKGSVNELRCDYLSKVSLDEQLDLSKFDLDEKREELLAEEKKAHRHLIAALDVNGAVLRYAEGNLDCYRKAFDQKQTELFKTEISTIIKENRSLKHSKKKHLVQQINQADNLPELVVILNDYANKWLPEDHFAKKYLLQSTIQELLFVYKQVGHEETSDLQTLRATYFDNVVGEIAIDLESTLSWAKKGNRGLGYLLERKAVINAANGLLQAVAQLKSAATPQTRRTAIKNLYKILAEHEAKLKDLWIFSFGHKNTYSLIKQSLSTLDGLTAIGSDKDALNEDFMHDCREDGLNHVLQEKFSSAVLAVEKNYPEILKNTAEWATIKKQLNSMRSECESIYVFNEMKAFLSERIEALRKEDSPLVPLVNEIRGVIRKMWGDVSQQHKDLVNESKYFKLKAASHKTRCSFLDGFTAEQVILKAGNDGFNEYLDLTIKGKGSHSLFSEFIHYNSQYFELTKLQAELISQLDYTKAILPRDKLLNDDAVVDVEQFPKYSQEQAKVILKLRDYIKGQFPEDLSAFSHLEQINFQDRELMKTFDFNALNIEKIHQIKDYELRCEFIQLYNKMHPVNEPDSWWSGVIKVTSHFFINRESKEDWYYQFHDLQNRSNSRLSTILSAKIDQCYQEVSIQKKIIEEKNKFLHEKIAEEKLKSEIYCKRFNSMDEFYAFDAQLKKISEASTSTKPDCKSKRKGDEMLHLSAEESMSDYNYFSVPGR